MGAESRGGRDPSVGAERPGLHEALVVAGVALLVRAAFLLTYRESPFFAAPVLDSAQNDLLARAFAAGDWNAGAPYFRPPLFLWVLGILYRVFGEGPWPGRLLGAGCGALTALAVLWTGARLGLGKPWRLAAALATAAAGPLLFLEGELLAEPLATALAAWGLCFATAAWIRPEPARPWIAAAFLWSLSALARAPLALLPVFLVVLSTSASGRRWRRTAGLSAMTALVWCGPALLMARNGAGFSFPATQGGVNFAAGNNPAADGRSVSLPEGLSGRGWEGFEAASVREASRRAGRTLGPREASAFWFGEGADFWREDPGRALALAGRKALFALHGYESPNNRSLYRAGEDSPVLRLLLVEVPGVYWPSGLVVPLALAGFVAAARRRERAWVPVAGVWVLGLLPLVAFFVCARFRAPVFPAGVLLAALGAASLLRWRAGRPLVAALYLVANAPWPAAVAGDPAREDLVRAEALLNAGRLEEADGAYRRTLRADPGEARAALGLAVVAERSGRYGEAEHALGAARALDGRWFYEAAWARVLDRLGRPEEALPHLLAAAEDAPENALLRARLGLTLEVLGRDTEAARELEAASLLGARDAEALNSLGRYRRLAGDSEGALEAWNRAIAADPDHFKSLYNRGLARLERGDREGSEADLGRAVVVAPDEAGRALASEALELARNRLP